LFDVPKAHSYWQQGDSLLGFDLQLRQDKVGLLLARLLGFAPARRSSPERLLRRGNRPA
jgi:hypothetical protein